MAGVPPTPPAAVLAAGLLPPWLDPATTTAEEIASLLIEQLDGQALWDPHQDQPWHREEALATGRIQLPVWQPPAPDLLAAHVPDILAAWEQAVDRYSPGMVRVQTRSLPDLRALRSLGPLDGRLVVGSLPARGGPFTWQVPPRIWVAGPRAEAWQEVVRRSGWYQLDAEVPDLLVVDADPLELDRTHLPWCGTVIAVGNAPAADLLDVAGSVTPWASVLAGVPRPFEEWWDAVLHQGLHHNLPLDCALAWLVPDAVVAGVGIALTLTATPSESHAEPVELDLGPREAGIEPPETHEPEPAADRRRLITAFHSGERELRTLLPPEHELTLSVRIAIPKRGEVAADTAIASPETDEPVVKLEIEARSEVWPTPQRGQVSLRLDRPDEPSDATGWRLTTPASGSTLLVVIDVSYAGRLLQRATLTAPVRDFPLPGDLVRLAVQQTSAGPTPTTVATTSDVLLDATAAELTRWQRDDARIGLGGLPAVLNRIELGASRVLGREQPPTRLDHPEALELLIDLARIGADLRELIDPLDVRDAPVVTLIVDEHSRILPLELVYDAEPPRRSARLCEHATDPPPPGQRCDRAGRGVVCPYAFWGPTRTVIRDVLLGPGTQRRPPQQLSLSPVLFAATSRADAGAAADPLPSASLAESAATWFAPVERATSWSDWRVRVGRSRPQLLLLLAHTDVADGEAFIEISRSSRGWPSVLFRPDIGPDLLGRGDGPLPLVMMVSCVSAALGDSSGTIAGTLTSRGAAAVVGLLAQLSGAQGARVGQALLESLHGGRGGDLAAALTDARRRLLAEGFLVGLLVVAHGQIDVGLG